MRDHSLLRLTVRTLSTSVEPSKRGATQSSSSTSMRACGRKRRSAWSEGVASTVSPMERRRTTSTRPTRDQSQRAGPSGRGSSSLTNGGACAAARGSACLAGLFILDCRLFDDQRGDVVADGVDASTFDALDAARVRLQLHAAAASRADDPERLDEILRDWQLLLTPPFGAQA